MSSISATPRHRVFLSYHDGRSNPSQVGDLQERLRFERLFANQAEAFVCGAVRDGDIDLNIKTETTRQRIRDGYLRNTSVTIVLVGARTWQRKHVDWEISSSLRDTPANPRSGLLGILLSSFPSFPRYDPRVIPPRLHDNIEAGYAKLYRWTDNPVELRCMIHEAFLARTAVLPNNARLPYANNHTGPHW